MYGEFEVGGTFPRPEDQDRLARYEQAFKLFNGEHQDSAAAKRIADKLSAQHQFTRWHGYSAEGTVWLVYNLPRLICEKFADLQVLNSPIVMLEDEAQQEQFDDALREGVKDLWHRVHYAMQLKRAIGDVPITISRGKDGGPVDLRVVDPRKWFPVIDPNDPMNVLAHQIAWIEAHGDGKTSIDLLRVDVCYPDRLERRAFKLRGKQSEYSGSYEIEAQVDLGTYWPGLSEVDEADLGGMTSCVHLANGCIRPGEIFGRPQFYDSASLIDDINWRLSTWSDANDRVAHAPEVIDKSWLSQDEDGTVMPPSQYARRFVSSSGRSVDAQLPQYMAYPLDFETLRQQFEASVLAFLIRNEMSPALLGLQFGRERESGEAKSLGMGTTEAATRRDLLQTQPRVDQALTVAARLIGLRGVEVSTHWRVGLPKTQAELMQELQQKRAMGLVTRRDMLEQLYPWMPAETIDAKLAELDEERQAAIDELDPGMSQVG